MSEYIHSEDDLKNKKLNFLDYFNQTTAKYFKWTCKDREDIIGENIAIILELSWCSLR